MSEHKQDLGGKRRLTRDLYALKGRFEGGLCVDHLVPGTVFTLSESSQGETCLYASGREYPLSRALLHDALTRSKSLQA